MATILRLGCLSLAFAAQACCVAAGTRVRTPRGEVPLGTLVPGAEVCSIDIATGRLLTTTVVQVRKATRECLALRWDGGELVCTPDHPLYAPETGTYRPASDWVTGTARTLLVAHDDGVRVVTVVARDTFAGVHEVVDITVDADPHNFIAAGVVVHNKSPAGGYIEAQADGPKLELGPGESTSFRVRTCIVGDSESYAYTQLGAVVSTLTGPTDDIPAEVTIRREDHNNPLTALVPFDEGLDLSLVSCDPGAIVHFARSDPGASGSVSVAWNVEAHIDYVEAGVSENAKMTILIEPEP